MKRTLLNSIAFLMLLFLFTNVTRAETIIDTTATEEKIATEANTQDNVEIKSSSYISSYAISIAPSSSGKITVYFEVTGTSYMDKIGVSSVYIQEYRNGIWYNVKSFQGYNYNSPKYINEIIYNGVIGRTYRAKATYYAEKNGGSDTRTKTSSSVIAK